MSSMDLNEIGKRARAVEQKMASLTGEEKENCLLSVSESLLLHSREILEANQIDIGNAKRNGMKEALVDRLLLTEKRIGAMAEGLRQVAALEDPIGEVLSMKQRPNGLLIGQKRVPIGVIGIIYEARPNVTADAFGLCFKTGNPVILKGGSDAVFSNKKIVEVIRQTLIEAGLSGDEVQLIEDTDRETTMQFVKLDRYVDVLIPRGSAGLIRFAIENSTIPMIETGTGNCHIFVDESADFDMALNIIENAKTQRIGVCNACESLVVHEKIAEVFLPLLAERLSQKTVEMRGDSTACRICREMLPASDEDWGMEYLDYIISIKTVSDIQEAIAHINRYNTKHSEAIITNNYTNATLFLNEVDAAAVYVNASTRFTDGYEFGFGAEIGISTQKLHARGPMGLKELTSLKYIIYGNGQIRE